MAPQSKAEPAYAIKPGGAHALGPPAFILGEDDDYPGWEVTGVTVAEMGRPLRLPMFGWAHTKLRKAGGNGAYNGAFLAVRSINPPDDPYGALLEGFWCIAKEDLPTNYKKWNTVMHFCTDTKQHYKLLTGGELIVDLNWSDTVALADFEPSACVKIFGKNSPWERTDLATADHDTMDVTHVLRQHKWKLTTPAEVRGFALRGAGRGGGWRFFGFCATVGVVGTAPGAVSAPGIVYQALLSAPAQADTASEIGRKLCVRRAGTPIFELPQVAGV
jgi:hypothetical protein